MMRAGRLGLLLGLCLWSCGGERVVLGETPDGGGGSGGNSGSGGSAGSSGAPASSEKLDLLFVVDNSISMADKHELLIPAVTELLSRLTNPRCVDASGKAIAQPKAPLDACPSGSTRELPPVRDMNVGVISSSLGSHGGDICNEATAPSGSNVNDRAHLMGSVRPNLASFDQHGYLKWDPEQKYGGEVDAGALVKNVYHHIEQAGETGCGFEAPLEAMYRFLSEPEPWQTVTKEAGFGKPEGIDSVLLAQRAAFLRPDSTVAIVLLSDENDCSIRDFGAEVEGQAWLVATQTSGGVGLPRAVSICKTKPNDACCHSCGQGNVPGCPPVGSDPECSKGNYPDTEDHLNLRCWDQKRRFGVDWLYPTQRYVDGLTKPAVDLRSGKSAPNPLFAGGRSPSAVLLAGIVGLPWQSVATSESLAPGVPLTLVSGTVLSQRLTMMLPDGSEPPQDAFMVETFEQRSGKNPVSGHTTAPSNAGFMASPINGHERDIVAAGASTGPGDLQYACIFALNTPRDCSLVSAGCECSNGDAPDYAENDPMCQDPSSGGYGTLQRFAKGYPGTRQLSVLRGLGDAAIAGSVCPKSLSGSERDAGYGYNPIFTALLGKLAPRLK